jgi:hypothetical protein
LSHRGEQKPIGILDRKEMIQCQQRYSSQESRNHSLAVDNNWNWTGSKYNIVHSEHNKYLHCKYDNILEYHKTAKRKIEEKRAEFHTYQPQQPPAYRILIRELYH